jgi:hypothetical protein
LVTGKGGGSLESGVHWGAAQPGRNGGGGGASGGGGQRLMAQKGGHDMGGHWGGIDGACRWPEVARRWSTLGIEADGGR